MANTTTIEFEVLIDESFASICVDATIKPTDNKNLLSLINDFESKKWRYDKFQNFVWDNIAETALSVSERNKLADKNQTRLVTAARNLRLTDKADDVGGGSELAEIVLYGIMKHHFKALSVVPKIFYKQNSQDNAKGADTVHIVVAGNDFTLWFGEAKFYNSIEDARVGEIIKSVENSLKTDKLKKENSIVTNIGDLDQVVSDKTLLTSIKKALESKQSIDTIKPRLHIPILLLHECKITQKCTELTDEYRKEIIEFHKERAHAYFKKQTAKLSTKVHLYEKIRFHLILLPVPSKKNIVTDFTQNVKHYKGQNKRQN